MKAAVIGMGPHGRRVASALRSLPGLELAAVVDARADALAAADLPAEVARHSDAAVLWAAPPELVCITTNGPSHAALAIAALDAGVGRVMVEKPMGCSVAECDAMIAAATRRGARLSVDQSRRHDPLYRWLRTRIRSGEWGQLRCLWIQRPGIGLACLGTHSFDLARFLMEREVRTVTAWLDEPIGRNPRGAEYVDPGGLVVLELAGGARAVISQIEDGAGPMSVELDLTAARVRIDEKSGQVEIVRRDLSVKPGPSQGAKYEVETVPSEVATRPELGRMLAGVLGELAGDGPMDCAASHGLAAVAVLAAAYVSARGGHAPVALPLDAASRALWMPVT